jgi:DNA polymerase III subunit beta
MKVNFNRAALAEALGLLASVVPARTPKPILRCVRLTAGEKVVTIRATDLEVGVHYQIYEVQVDKTGEVVVPADKLTAVIRENTDETIAVEVKDGICSITCADSHYTIYGQDADSFPDVPGFDGQPDLEVGLQNLQSAIRQTLFATAKESTRYALNGILWEVKGKKLALVATDGRRLARCRINLITAASKNLEASKIIVPAKTLSLLEKLPAGDKDSVAVKFVDNRVLLACGNVVVSSNLIEGTFPKYEDIIPSDYDKKLTLQTEATLSAVRRSALLTSEESRGVRLAVSKNLIVFSCRSPETGDAQIDMHIDYTGSPVEIGFNPQYITDCLRILPDQQFELELGSPDRPGLIKCGKDFLYVLMPINLG